MRRNPKIVAFGPGAAQAAGLVPNIFTLEEASAVLEEAPQFLARHGLTLDELGPAVLGMGLYAKVFMLPDRRVLKMTTDRDDAEASELIRKAGKVPGLVRVFEVRQFRRPVTERTLDLSNRTVIERQSAIMFGIISERVESLKDLPSAARIERREVVVGPAAYAAQLARKWFVELVDRNPRWSQRELTAIEASMNRTIPDSTVETIAVQMVRELATGWRWLQHSGYEVTDLHPGNFGLVGTRLVMFDFGNDSGVGVREHPPIELAANRRSNVNVRMNRVAAVFDECFDELCDQFEDFGELGLKHDERAGEDNGAGADRQFGYCADGDPIVVAFAAKTEQLDEAQIRGLMRHEFGHALEYRYGVAELEERLGAKLPKTIERRADVIAELVWGEPIEYGDRDIQCVGCGGKSPRPGYLAKNGPADELDPMEKQLLAQIDRQIDEGGGWANMKRIAGGQEFVYRMIELGILEDDGGFVRRRTGDVQEEKHYCSTCDARTRWIEAGREIRCTGCGATRPTPEHLAKNAGTADLDGAKKLAQLLKRAGTASEDASERIQQRYGLSEAELRGVLRAVWGSAEKAGSTADDAEVEKIVDRIYADTVKGQRGDDAMFALLEVSGEIESGRKKHKVPLQLRREVARRLRKLADSLQIEKNPGPPKALLERAVKDMQVHLGSVDRVAHRDAQRLYQRAMKSVNAIADKTGLGSTQVWEQVEAEARRRGTRLALPGKDI